MLALSNIFNLLSYILFIVVIFRFYVIQIYGSARPNEGTTCLSAGLAHCLYSLGWHDMTYIFLGLLGSNPFDPKHNTKGLS
jgi:hypothetical protein